MTKNILVGWTKAGLFPFNPDRVLRGITKPVTVLPGPNVHRDPCSQEVIQTPVTPVTSDDLSSLLRLIKQEPHDKTSTQRRERLVQKLANAAETSFS